MTLGVAAQVGGTTYIAEGIVSESRHIYMSSAQPLFFKLSRSISLVISRSPLDIVETRRPTSASTAFQRILFLPSPSVISREHTTHGSPAAIARPAPPRGCCAGIDKIIGHKQEHRKRNSTAVKDRLFRLQVSAPGTAWFFKP